MSELSKSKHSHGYVINKFSLGRESWNDSWCGERTDTNHPVFSLNSAGYLYVENRFIRLVRDTKRYRASIVCALLAREVHMLKPSRN